MSARGTSEVDAITFSLLAVAAYRAAHRFVHHDGIIFQDGPDRSLQRRLRLLIAGERGNFGGSRARQVALVLNDVETGRGSDLELVPFRRKDLLLKDSLAPRSFEALAS